MFVLGLESAFFGGDSSKKQEVHHRFAEIAYIVKSQKQSKEEYAMSRTINILNGGQYNEKADVVVQNNSIENRGDDLTLVESKQELDRILEDVREGLYDETLIKGLL